MRRRSLFVLGSLLLTFVVGIGVTALVCERASRGGVSETMKWAVGVYLLFLSAVYALALTALKLGAFRDVEAAKYYMLTIDEEDYYTPDDARPERRGE